MREREALAILAKEFYPDQPQEEVISRYQNLITRPPTHPQGARLEITPADTEGVEGFLMIKYYPWGVIAPQIYFGVCRIDQIPHLYLLPLEQHLLNKLGERGGSILGIERAVELAFFWVKKEARHQGRGNQFFQSFLASTESLHDPKGQIFVFTVARPRPWPGQPISKAVLDYMVLKEREANGIDPTSGLARINGHQ